MVSLLFVATVLLTSNVYHYLSFGGELKKGESVVVFGGGSGLRALQGANLVVNGYGHELVLCGTKAELSFLSGLLQVHYPEKKYSIPIVKVHVTNTRETIKYIVSRLREDRHMRILGVTSCWHLRRSMTLLQYYGGDDAERCRLTDSGYRVDFNSNSASGPLALESNILLKYSFYDHFLQVWSEFSKYLITHCLVSFGAEPL